MAVGYGDISFTVDANGTVSTTQTDSATASGSTLTFRNTAITIDPVSYTGSWKIDNGLGLLQGRQTIIVVPALTYQMVIAFYGSFFFAVDANGTVSIIQ